MRNFIGLIAVLALVTVQSYASITTNQVYQLNKQMGAVASLVELGTVIQDPGEVDGLKFQRVARATYDVTVDGSTASSTYGLGESLPANAIVSHAWFQVITAFQGVDNGAMGVSLECVAGNDDLYGVNAGMTTLAAGELEEGIPTGGTTLMFDVGTSACELSAVVSSVADGTIGKLVLWVEYVVSE